MGFHHSIYSGLSLNDYLEVIIHGLPLDLSIAAYLTALPSLLMIASLWIKGKFIHYLERGYYAVISLLVSLIFVSDLGLYEYWGFRLDSTPFFYFFSSPKDAVASVSIWVTIIAVLSILLIAFLLFMGSKRLPVNGFNQKNRFFKSLGVLFLTGLLFIPIRGGFTVSTLNTGRVYFSSNMKLNHAAINPCFSLLESLSRNNNFDQQYRFLDPKEADRVFSELQDNSHPKQTQRLLNTQRPNIIIVVLESFMSQAMESLGGQPNVAIQMDRLGREGVLFTHFYANSFRTDRGLVSILSGYPAQPTTSIMKYPRKTQHLPSIGGRLKKEGYHLQYCYGGDADFTNMRSYLTSMGFESIISDADFPLSEKLSKWGAHDHVLFNKVYDQIAQEQETEPFFKVIQTSSSHEPFKVPFQRLTDERMNSIAYTDSCLGNFIDKYKQTKYWDHTLFVLVPDHAMHYPADIDDMSVKRYEIPLILCGGVIAHSQKVETYGSQADISATLLAQLGLSHQEFTFSKDLLNPDSPHFAFFTFPDIFGFITPQGKTVYDCTAKKTIDSGQTSKEDCRKGQAYLQKLYDDLAKR